MERNHSQQPLWRPTDGAVSQMAQFMAVINQQHSCDLKDYFELHAWSIAHPGEFWQAFWEFAGIIASEPARQIYVPAQHMQDTQWFVGAKLNFAENLLRYRDKKAALVFRSESGEKQTLSYHELYQQVSALADWLRQMGVAAGDRVVGWLPNCPATVIAMLAAASLGAIWSACSCDFGLTGVLERFGQIDPKILFVADTHTYKGRTFSHWEDIKALQQRLPSLMHTVMVPSSTETADLQPLAGPASHWQDCLTSTPAPLTFQSLPFNHPLYILYSSGTTGKPKCMVHSAGGTLIQHLKELRLHTDLKREDTIFFYTTCAWMMWHWLVSSLAVGATLVLYEGNPFYPESTALFDLIDECGITVFGVGAQFVENAEKFGLCPRQSHQLANLQTILTTGSPLLPASFDYIYRDVKPTARLSSISGGSDIISCFALGNPLLPVYRGELQCLGLGMDVRIFNEAGCEVNQDTKGELVCVTPFPSMPVFFWNDPNGEKYHQAYFERFPKVWTHGDYAQRTASGGLIIYGRSDTILNPGGIRIGTAEIYQQIEKFPEILDCLAVGQTRPEGERIILFVTLREGEYLTDELISALKTTIRHQASPHHVPAKIIQAPDLPRTLNGKLMEIAIKKIINHQPFTHLETLANPKSLQFFQTLDLDSSNSR